MEATPERAQRPSLVGVCGLILSGGWSLGWPLLYAILDHEPKSTGFISLSHVAAVVWLLSIVVFFWILVVLAESSAICAFILDILLLCVEAVFSCF